MRNPDICPNNVIRTHLVSFPRSGHHLMVRGLTEALDNRLVYSEFYTCKHNFSNCEFVNLQKSHDFDGDDPIDPDGNYIVMIREFADAAESWWLTTDTVLSFEDFLISKKPYYESFMKKWVDYPMKNRLLINYDHFVLDKTRTVISASRHMGVQPNIDKIRQWDYRESVRPFK